MKESFVISCPCLFGLESILAGECRRIGFQSVEAENGRVRFIGGFKEVVQANLWLRTAERVQIELGRFPAYTFEELFEGTYALPFEEFLLEDTEFPITGFSLNSQLSSVPDCQSIIKKAAVKRLEKKYGITWFEETGPTMRIQFGLLKNQVSIYIDTSGAPLHKRGYRAVANEAPIKETLAAGIVDLARIHDDNLVLDPFCGSGTLLIEAGLKAMDIAPGINRNFQFELWENVSPVFIKEEKEKALDLVKRDAQFIGQGWDIDPISVELTLENAKKAGIGKKIKASVQDIADFQAPSGRARLITNPPYGERLLDEQEAARLYKIMGNVFPPAGDLQYSIISSSESFEDLFGRPADKRRKLYNGTIRCWLYQYFRRTDKKGKE